MKYSIIMASMNSSTYIERAITSVLGQSWTDCELIIQDGGSTDGTLDILKQYEHKLSWRSAPDSGVYDAWNKALERTSGDWALFLGSDDFLLQPTILEQCSKQLQKMERNILFAFGALCMGHNGTIDTVLNRSVSSAYQTFLVDMGLPFPATFIRCNVAKKVKFDTSYKIAGDFDFVARCIRHDSIARLPFCITYMEWGGMSTRAENKLLLRDERKRILHTHIRHKAHEIIEGHAQGMWDTDKSLHDDIIKAQD